MSAFENSSSASINSTLVNSKGKSLPSSPIHHPDQYLRTNPSQLNSIPSPHVIHQSYSSTSSLEKQAHESMNSHAFRTSPSYLTPLNHHHVPQQDITNPQQNSSAIESSSVENYARSNHRNSPPSQQQPLGIVRGQSHTFTSQQENEANYFNNTTKTSNNHHQPVPFQTSASMMNGSVAASTTASNGTNLVSTSSNHHQEDKIGSYHSNRSGGSNSVGLHAMNGSSSHHSQSPIYGMNNSTYDMGGQRSGTNSNASIHDKHLLPSVHILMDSPTSTSSSNPIPQTNSRIYAPPSSNPGHMRQSSTNNLQQSNYMNHQPPITPIPYSQHVIEYSQPNHVPYNNNNTKASHHIDMFTNPPVNNHTMKTSTSMTSMDANNMYAPRPIRSRSNTSGPTTSFNSPPPPPPSQQSSSHNPNETVYSFEQPSKIKKKKPSNNDDSNDNDKKNWKKKRLFSIDEVTDLVAFVKQRSENQELTRDVNYAIFKEYEKLQDERRRASVYRKKYVQLFERHLISKDGAIDPSLFQEYDQRASSKTKGTHSEDVQEKRKFSDVEEDSSCSEGSTLEEEKKTKKVKREYSDEEEEEIGNVSPSEDKKKNMNICVSYKGKYYLHSIEKNILQNSDSIHNYFTNLTVSRLCCNNDSELIRNESIEYFDYSFGEFIQINSFSVARVLKSLPVKLRIN